MAENTNRWLRRLKLLPAWHQRFQRVQIDNVDALTAIRFWDSEDTVFYVDPPYSADSRAKGDVYDHECDDGHHQQLVELLLTIKGQVMLSGYETPIYKPLDDAGWRRIEIDTACHTVLKGRRTKLKGEGAALEHAARTEVVWIKEKHERRLF